MEWLPQLIRSIPGWSRYLKKGGNAVDAAVATGFALGVLEANANGIGGGGFMIIKMVDMDEPVVIDFRRRLPARPRRPCI